MTPLLRAYSSKPPAPKGWKYLISLMDFEAALQPRLSADAFLSVRFSERQALWKKDRDRVDETRCYRVLQAHYADGREHVPRLPEAPEPWAQNIPPYPRTRASWRLEITYLANLRRLSAAEQRWNGHGYSPSVLMERELG